MSDVASPDVNRFQSLRGPLIVGALGVGAVGALHFRDPHVSTWSLCPFNFLTGLPCPGCGGLRAVNLLSNGDVIGAMSSNLMVVVAIPVFAVAWGLWLWRRANGDQNAQFFKLSNSMSFIALGAIIVFGVFRLTPWGAWLAP